MLCVQKAESDAAIERVRGTNQKRGGCPCAIQ